MPSQSRPQYRTVEVRPEGSRKPSNLAPSSPTPGSPGKTVRWNKDTIVKAAPREPTPTEAWSFYHFECHARQCRACLDPLHVYEQGRQLCATGYGLAQDVAEHVYRQDGVVYSRTRDQYKRVPVELPHDYDQMAQVLRVKERQARQAGRQKAPIIHQPASAPQQEDYFYEQVIVEPASSADRNPRRHASKHKKVVVVDEDDERRGPAPAVQQPRERRGSLYYEDLKRQRKEEYKVEVRKPWERRQRPKSSYGDVYY